MDKKNLPQIFKESLSDFIRHPSLLFPPILLFIIISLLSILSVSINHKLSSSLSITLWFIIFTILYLIIISYISATMIGMSRDAASRSISIKKVFPYGNKFWLKNLVIILIFILIYFLILGSLYVFTFLMSSLRNYIQITENVFKLLSFLIYFIWLVAVLIFFTFSNFFLVIYNLKIKESILKSISFVKKEYLSILSINVIFFAIFYLLSFWESTISIILTYLLTAFFILLLTRFLLSKNQK